MATEIAPQAQHIQNPESIPEILDLEASEEARARSAQEKMTEEETLLRHKQEEEAQTAENDAKVQSEAEIEAFRVKELSDIVARGEADREKALKELDAAYKQSSPGTIERLAETMLHSSI